MIEFSAAGRPSRISNASSSAASFAQLELHAAGLAVAESRRQYVAERRRPLELEHLVDRRDNSRWACPPPPARSAGPLSRATAGSFALVRRRLIHALFGSGWSLNRAGWREDEAVADALHQLLLARPRPVSCAAVSSFSVRPGTAFGTWNAAEAQALLISSGPRRTCRSSRLPSDTTLEAPTGRRQHCGVTLPVFAGSG